MTGRTVQLRCPEPEREPERDQTRQTLFNVAPTEPLDPYTTQSIVMVVLAGARIQPRSRTEFVHSIVSFRSLMIRHDGTAAQRKKSLFYLVTAKSTVVVS